jgi:hypothetical protein
VNLVPNKVGRSARRNSYELGGRYRPTTDLNVLGHAGRSNRSWVCIYRQARRIFGGSGALAFDYLDQMRLIAHGTYP